MRHPSIQYLLAAFSAAAALCWVALVPIWDGFDEPLHYGYIQALRTELALPTLGHTRLTPEVWSSLLRTPVSPAVKVNYPMLTTFGEARGGMRASTVAQPGTPLNYEAHQAPLIYILLAPAEAVLAQTGVPIAWRVRILRFCLLAVAMLLFWRISDFSVHRSAIFFVIVTTEMFLACCGRIANEALAIPILVWLFFEAERRSRLAIGLLVAGLLVKAYFLAFVPVVTWRLRQRWRLLLLGSVLPALWYARNLALYGNVSGMQEQLKPINAAELFQAAIGLPWKASLGETYRGALWMANNSLNQWSVWQVNVVIGILLTAAWYSIRQDKTRRNWLLAFGGSYVMALAYAAVQTFAATKGVSTAASPWYATPLWLLIVVVIFSGQASRWILSLIVAIWAYWFVATFWFRLVPLYSGLMDGPASITNLSRWYRSGFDQMRREIGDGVLALGLITSIAAVAIAAKVVVDLRTKAEG